MEHKILFDVLFLSFYMLLTIPATAEAYLDPGTGNILVYVMISLAGAALYALKGAFYWVLGWGRQNKRASGTGAVHSKTREGLVLFSEGKNYWGTFKPIVEALIARECPFTYYTMDVHDPALTIESDFMNSRYISGGSRGFVKMNGMDASILLATTPNIGTPGYPLSRPEKVGALVHVWHSLGDFAYAWYHKGALDNYDVILTVGSYMERQIRLIESKRSLKAKKIVPVGVPYLDVLAEKIKRPLPETDGKTILVAPSWGNKGCLSFYGGSFIRDLALAGYNVILRPHPQSLKVEMKLIDSLRKEFSGLSSISWDFNADSSASMEKADLLISDVSAVRMDFAFLYERPVITLEMPVPDISEWEYEDLAEILKESTMDADLGERLPKEEISSIREQVSRTLSESRHRDFTALRNKYVSNFRRSGEAVAEYLISELQKQEER